MSFKMKLISRFTAPTSLVIAGMMATCGRGAGEQPVRRFDSG